MENSLFADKTVYNTRKENCSERETACYDALEGLGIGYSRVSHEHIGTIEGLFEVNKALDVEICKNLFLCNAQKTDFYLLLMPGEKPFKTKLLSPQLGCSRLSFGSDERLKKHLGLNPGEVSPFGIINDDDADVNVVLDSELKKVDGYIGFHPNDNTAFVWLKFEDLIKFIKSRGNDIYYINI